MATKNEGGALVAALNDSHLVIRVDDGASGHFITVPAPKWTGAAGDHNTLTLGYRYEGVRVGQAAAKKARKDGKDPATAAREAIAKMNGEVSGDRIETVGTMRAELGTEGLKAVLAKKGIAATEATIALNLPKYMAKYAKEIDSALHAKLSGGYTPTRKGTGGTATATGGVEVDFE